MRLYRNQCLRYSLMLVDFILLLSGEGLLYVGDYVVDILDAYGEAYQVRCYSCFTQLLVGELAMGVACGMQHTCACVGNMCDYCYEFQAVHKFYCVLA